MAKFLVKSADIPTFRIDLSLGNPEWTDSWVEAKTALSLNDRDQINAGSISADPDTGRPVLDASHASTRNLSGYLVAWGGPGFTEDDGSVADINQDSVGMLSEDIAIFILKAIQMRAKSPVPPKDRALAATSGSSTFVS